LFHFQYPKVTYRFFIRYIYINLLVIKFFIKMFYVNLNFNNNFLEINNIKFSRDIIIKKIY